MRIVTLAKIVFLAFRFAYSVDVERKVKRECPHNEKKETLDTSDSLPQDSGVTCDHIQNGGIDDNSLLQKASRLNIRETQGLGGSLAQGVSGEVKPSRGATNTFHDYTSEDSISVIFPGFGEANRMDIMKEHITLLRQQNVPLDCTVFVYRSETEFPLNSSDFLPCTILRHRGFYSEHIKAFHSNASRRPWVLLWTDSVVLGKTTDFARMISVAKVNQLDHLSINTHPDLTPLHKTRPTRNGDGVGYRCRTPEFQVDLFRLAAFECLQNEAIDADENPTFWGASAVFSWACKPKQGVWDEVLWQKWASGSQTRTPRDRAEAIANMRAHYKKARAKGFPDGTENIGPFSRVKLEPLIDPNLSNV